MLGVYTTCVEFLLWFHSENHLIIGIKFGAKQMCVAFTKDLFFGDLISYIPYL